MAAFVNYFESGGKVLSFGSQFDSVIVARHEASASVLRGVVGLNYKSWNDVQLMFGSYTYKTTEVTGENVKLNVIGSDKDGNALIVDVKGDNGGHAILSQVNVDSEYVGSP